MGTEQTFDFVLYFIFVFWYNREYKMECEASRISVGINGLYCFR